MHHGKFLDAALKSQILAIFSNGKYSRIENCLCCVIAVFIYAR